TRPHHLTQLHITHPRQRHARRETRPGHSRRRSGGEAFDHPGQVGARCHPGHRRIPPTPPVSDHHHRHTLIRHHQPRPTIHRRDQVPPHPRINPITHVVDLVARQTHPGIIIRAPGRVPCSQIVRNSRDNLRTRQTPTRSVVLIIPTVEHAHTLPDTCSNHYRQAAAKPSQNDHNPDATSHPRPTPRSVRFVQDHRRHP